MEKNIFNSYCNIAFVQNNLNFHQTDTISIHIDQFQFPPNNAHAQKSNPSKPPWHDTILLWSNAKYCLPVWISDGRGFRLYRGPTLMDWKSLFGEKGHCTNNDPCPVMKFIELFMCESCLLHTLYRLCVSDKYEFHIWGILERIYVDFYYKMWKFRSTINYHERRKLRFYHSHIDFVRAYGECAIGFSPILIYNII